MKKIVTFLILLVCSTGAFAQYIQNQGGIVSQGTLVNESSKEVEAVRKGWDGWVGVGGGIGGFPHAVNSVNEMTAAVFDANLGCNVAPRVFIGVGCSALYGKTTLSNMYVNLRTFSSKKANSLFNNIRFGYVLTGTIAEDNRGEAEGYNDYCYYKPQGIMGGYSMGYLWNHFAFEVGFSVIGGLEYKIGRQQLNPYGLDWGSAHGEYLSVSPALEAFCRLSWRF